MKTGLTLEQLAAEIDRRAGARKDYLVSTNSLGMEVDPEKGTETRLVFEDEELPINDLAHHQIAERMGIPVKYYDRMLTSAPHLLSENVNHWMSQANERRMVRTLDGRVRAYLSDRYQRIDNHSVAHMILPVLLDSTRQFEIVSCEVTERRLYIKATDKSVVAEVKESRRVGDLVEAGVMITNSEVGLGAVSVHPFLNFLRCKNGMVISKAGMRAAHVGTRLDLDDQIASLLADDTRKVLDQGVLMKVRDTVRALLDPVAHQARIDRMNEHATTTLADPIVAVEELCNDFDLSGSEKGSVLRHLVERGDLSRYGLINAVTRTAEDADDYDRATELETLGGRLLEMPANDWQRIAALKGML